MRLKNRKRYFTQWDKGQILIVDECPAGTQIHFTNTKSDLAYVLETNENLEVEVPDVLLQEPYPVTAWIYRINGTNYYTESRREFQVIKRARPESYIYTPEEQHYWETKVDKAWGAENYGKFLIVGEDGPYGLYIKTVNGITLDYDKDGKYWAFYENGKYAAKGASETEIVSGTTYSFKAE